VLAARPRSLIEIGASGGYSTIWTGTAARAVGGSLTTLEIDPVKIELASESLSDAGLDDAVTIVEGDAFAYMSSRGEPADFVFLDAEKEDYLAFLALIVPILSPGGVLVADNLISHEADLCEFRKLPSVTTACLPSQSPSAVANCSRYGCPTGIAPTR
jgi:predicted O-methyltransferase YrrM